MDAKRNAGKDSMIISTIYCMIGTTIYVSYINWSDDSLAERIVGCVCLVIAAIMIGCINGGLIGSILENNIGLPRDSRKYIALLLACNILSPLVLYLLIKYPSEYLE